MDYILRSIPEDVWQLAKHRAIDEKISLKELLLRALKKYLGD